MLFSAYFAQKGIVFLRKVSDLSDEKVWNLGIVVMSYYGENKNNSILLLNHVKKPVFLIYPP